MMQQGPLEDLRTFGALAQEIAGQADPAAAAARVVELAVKTVGCDWAGIGQIRAGRLTFLAGTDADLSKEITRIAYDTGESITMQACQSGTAVLCNDLTHDRLWPRASPLGVARTPVRAVLAFPLHLQEQELGVLTCYSGTVGFFGQEQVGLAGVYADHAAMALSLVREHRKVRDLTAGLDSNRQVGIAIGIVMAQLQVSAAVAFNVLRVASQNSNRKLRDVAEQVGRTGQVPQVHRRGHPTHVHPEASE